MLFKRPCLNELQKEYCVKIKLLALDWQWVTLISWCQMNHLGHSSSVMQNVEGKTHKRLEKLKIMSRNYPRFWHFLMEYFQITWVDIHISLNKNDNTPILHTCLTLCWSCLCPIAGYLVDPLWFWVLRVKIKKLYRQVGVIESIFFLENFDLLPLFYSHDCMKMLLNTYILCKFQIWNNFFLMFKIKCEKWLLS